MAFERTEKMINELIKETGSRKSAISKLSEIEKHQLFNHYEATKNQQDTVGSYFKRNRQKCLQKFSKHNNQLTS